MQPAIDVTGVCISNILINNIHCASCVSYIYELLAPFGPLVRDIDINVMTGEVRVAHDNAISTQQICARLNDGAFEVDSATARSDAGPEESRILFDGKKHALEGSPRSDRTQILKPQDSWLQLPKSRMHAEKCDACRKELEEAEEAIRKLENDFGDVDVERLGELRRVAISHRSLSTEETLVGSDSGRTYRKPEETAITSRGQKSKAVLSVSGMTCASCTGAIDRGLRELPFVEDVEVVLMTNSASITYTGKNRIEEITRAVDDLGYSCEVEATEVLQPSEDSMESGPRTQRTITLRVDGMYCKHCPPRISGSLQRTYGSSLTVDEPPSITTPFVKITYTPDAPRLTIRSIIATIHGIDTAFKASPYHAPSVEERSQILQRLESHRLLLRVLFSFVIAIPTFLLGVVWMSLVSSSDPIRRWFDTATWSGSVARRDWALFILATLVFFLAADVFHVRSLKEIRSLWRWNSRVPILRRFYRFGSMNLLVSAGTSVAYFSSVAILAIDATMKPGDGEMRHSTNYFDSVVFLTFFILIGRWLEVYSKAKTGNAIGLLGRLKPSEAVLIDQLPKLSKVSSDEESLPDPIQSTGTTTIDTDLLEVGDVVLVRHGSSPPADGLTVSSTATFNESSLTGEARPVAKAKGDKVFAGTINVGVAIQITVTELGGSSMLDQIVSVVREGQTKRAPVERLVDAITAYFVPVITALAIMTWLIWLSLGQSGTLDNKYLRSTQGGWAFWSLEFAIAVFVVACPCGIGLAAPTALFVGSGLAAKHGILARGGGEAFHEASRIDAVVFDKTGTLTQGGDLQVTDHEMLVKDGEAEIAWAITKALEDASTHPLARAIHSFASSHISTNLTTLSIAEEAGKGLRGSFSASSGTYEAALGSESYIETLVPATYFTDNTLSKWKSQAKSVAVLALRANPSSPTSTWQTAAIFAITDPIRPSAIPTLQALRERNMPTYMLTGDNPVTAAAVASTLGIPVDHVFAGVLPTQKAEKITWLQDNPPSDHQSKPGWPKSLRRSKNDGNKKATIAFVGDGTNDAPALTAASVSIALAHPSASDIALTSASFIILSNTPPTASPSTPSTHDDHLTTLLTLLTLSSRVFRRVKFNFAWAVVYNLILVPIAAGVLFGVRGEGWRLGPVWGSAAMAASSVSVVLSSLALRWEQWDQIYFWRKR